MAVDLARSLKVPLRISPTVQQLLIEGQARGMGGSSSGSVLILLEEAAGLKRVTGT